MSNNVLNTKIGSPYSFAFENHSKEQKKILTAELFEQLLIFDKVTITTNRINSALIFLISSFGINTVERLLESGYIQFMISAPVLVTSEGKQLENGQIDETVIYGQTPIAAGSLSTDDLDPERNIKFALSNFQLHKDRKRIFTKKALKNYIVPNGMLISTNSANIVIDAYKNNSLQELGLPFEKEPEQLNKIERRVLLDLGYKVLETALLSHYNLKSYENFEHFSICKQNFKNIGKAYNISDNTTTILRLEGLPDLKDLFIKEIKDFDRIFKIRHLPNAKYYRKWINEVGENSNSIEVTKEYLNEIKGNTKFFETNQGKFIKNLGVFGVNSVLGASIAGIPGAVAGYTLGLLETFWLDKILKGKNPSMFISDLAKLVENDKAL